MSLVEASLIMSDPAIEDSNAIEDTPTTSAMLDIVKQHLNNRKWKYQTDVRESRVLINAEVNGENGSYTVALDMRDSQNIFCVFVVSQLNFPRNNRRDLAIYVTKANYGLTLGNFELDMNEGGVRFRCSTTIAGGVLTDEMVAQMLGSAMVTMDRYFGHMVKVAYGNMCPEYAVKEVERDNA